MGLPPRYPVAPRAGAWIETTKVLSVLSAARLSRPVRARGLKPYGLYRRRYSIESRPVRARGLKQ